MNQILSLIQSAIVFGTVIMLGALGEILTEKSGNLNLGVPGIMSLGAIGSLIAGFYYELYTPNPVPFLCMIIALVGALLLSLLGGLIYAFLTITLRAKGLETYKTEMGNKADLLTGVQCNTWTQASLENRTGILDAGKAKTTINKQVYHV